MKACSHCSRPLRDDELIDVATGLVCEPCLAAGVKADQRRDSIDAAWAAVEAVLPSTHRLGALFIGDDADAPPDVPWVAIAEMTPEAAPANAHILELARLDISARGDSPTSALRTLAADLAERHRQGAT